MKYLSLLVSLLSMLPGLLNVVDQAVKAVEDAMPSATGAQKFAAAEARVNAIVSTLVQDTQVVSNLAGVLKPLINSAVAMFNAAGIFGHTSTKEAAPAG